MKTRFIAALLIAASAAVAPPAFASGYGPAPFYRPSLDKSVPQHDVSADKYAGMRDDAGRANEAVGGTNGASSESGSRQAVTVSRDVNLFKGH
jgi:hypothetical protein